MANLSNINNKLLVGTNGEVRIGDTATVANVKLRVKQTANQWPMQIVSDYAYGLSIDTSLGTYGSAGSLQIYTNAGTGFIVQNNGFVGIGTYSPDYKLEVQGVISSADAGLQKATFANVGNDLVLTSNADATNVTAKMLFNSSGAGGAGVSTKMIIDGSGNVGIGTDSPSATTKLHIRNATSNSYATLRLEGSNRGGIIQMYNQTSYPVSSIQTDQSGNTYFSTSGAFASTTLSAKMSILTTGELIQGNNTNGIIPGTSLLRLANTGIYGAGQTGPYGTYGGMIFNSSANYTGGARRYMITNGYLGTSLAFIRSANYNTDPSISGDDGTVSSGSVSYYIASTGYNIFPEYVGMGTTAPTSQLFVNNTVDGDKIRWGRSDALVGSVGTYNGVPYIGYQGGAGGGIMFNGSSIEPTALGSTRSSSTNDIGSNSYKWRNIYLSGGAYLGGTGSANHLDYYEEGSWTPVISHHDGSGVIPSTNSGSRYTRIGGMVHLQAYITAINPAGNAGTSSPYYGIRGFPFAPTSITTWEMVYVSSSVTSYGGYGSAASMYFLSLNSNGTNGAGHISGTVVNSWGANVNLMMSITYAIH